MPVRPELQNAISFLTSKLRVAGKFTEVGEKHRQKKEKPSSCKSYSWIDSGDVTGTGGAMLDIADLSFPLTLSAMGTILGFVIHFLLAPLSRWFMLWKNVRTLHRQFPSLVGDSVKSVKLTVRLENDFSSAFIWCLIGSCLLFR